MKNPAHSKDSLLGVLPSEDRQDVQGLQTDILDDSTLPIMILDRDMTFVYVNAAYLTMTQHAGKNLICKNVFDVFPDTAERVSAVTKKFEIALAGQTSRLEAQPFKLQLADGSVEDVVWQATQDPIRNKTGTVTHIIQRAENITAQYDLEKRNHAMTIEINHRIKNMMAVVSAIARISGRNAKDLPSFLKTFIERVDAMSRAHDRLAHDDWRGLSVEETLKVELEPYSEETGATYILSGPHVKLSIAGTKDLAMVTHELLTNAVKYGCFSTPGGALNVTWTLLGEYLQIDWQEVCDFEVSESETSGFGSKLFNMLPSLSVERSFLPTGLSLRIKIKEGDAFA